jgi:hypothetical protein
MLTLELKRLKKRLERLVALLEQATTQAGRGRAREVAQALGEVQVAAETLSLLARDAFRAALVR